jgi:hypothetical protein
MSKATNHQEGGRHYKDLAIQPVEYIHANGIGYFEGNVIKYVSRWRQKGGIEDLRKARHYIELLIELEMGQEPAPATAPIIRAERAPWPFPAERPCPVDDFPIQYAFVDEESSNG